MSDKTGIRITQVSVKTGFTVSPICRVVNRGIIYFILDDDKQPGWIYTHKTI